MTAVAGKRCGLRLMLAALLAAAALCVAPGSALAAPAAPAWTITASSFPTNFEPGSAFTTGEAGPGYQLVAVNVGGEATAGTFTITDTLPAGLEFASFEAPWGWYGLERRKTSMACGTAGPVLTCTGATPVLRSGEEAVITIPVSVEPTASASVLDTAEVSGGGAAAVSTSLETKVETAAAQFGFAGGVGGLFSLPSGADGLATTQAGSHPYQLSIGLGFTTYSAPGFEHAETLAAGGGVRDFSTVLPAGIAINPEATPVKCREVELEVPRNLEGIEVGCPRASQVGTIRVTTSANGKPGGGLERPVYNMVPPHGSPAELAFEVVGGAFIHLLGAVRGGRYELYAAANDVLAKTPVIGGQVVLWGEPADPSHDGVRGACMFSTSPTSLCELESRSRTAFITMPSACSSQLRVTAEADSWIAPTAGVRETRPFADAAGSPLGVQGCSSLAFEPSLAITPEVSNADSATGMDVTISVPQNEEYENEAEEPQLATANLKDVAVTLPPGVTVNPAAADGLGACGEGQIGYDAGAGEFTDGSPSCPDASKVGSIEVETPLLDHVLPGDVYLATPHENPFDSLLALYVVIDDPQSGIVVKLAGHVEADPVTGQLSTSFDENPQLPFSQLRLHFFGGSRASLATPQLCGAYSSQARLGPWSGTAPVSLTSPFPIAGGPGGGACAESEAQQPNAPSVEAGTTDPTAGAYAPFVLRLRREDGSQRISAVNVTMPPGLTGKLAGIAYCPEEAIAAAAAKSGKEEQESPSCPAASEVGKVTVGAGVGPSPYYVSGRAYLAGPYEGAPLSLAIVTPAVAGPFDLGTVVVRAALFVDLETARISVVSDPLPTILQGIPLDVRSIAVEMSRDEFTLNPTDCEPLEIGVEAVSTSGDAAHSAVPMRVGGCRALAFKPKVKVSLKGGTKRAGHPALRAVVTMPAGGANIARAQVGLPHSEFLDQGNLDKVCTQPELKAANCPKNSIYGHAKAWSPLLEKPLEGPVYLGVGYGHPLPDLVADLNGQIRILLHGRVDTTKRNGIRNTFEVVPDAPVSRFVIEMKGGKKYGLLENSEDICRKAQRISARFVAQNGRIAELRPKIARSCKKAKKKKR